MKDSFIYYPFGFLGLYSSMWSVNITLLLHTLCAVIIIIIIASIGRYIMLYKDNQSLSYFACFSLGRTLYSFVYETVGVVNKNLFSFTVFSFLAVTIYNILVLLPHLEEPTKNLNVCIAYAIYAFLFIHYNAYYIQKSEYWHHWFKMPLSSLMIPEHWFFIFRYSCYCIIFIINCIIALCALPFELISRLSLLLSLSFRLFGNMFAGSILMQLLESFIINSFIYHLVAIFLGLTLAVKFFSFFEGIIQAGVFILISLNNIAILVGDQTDNNQNNSEEKEKIND